MRFDPDFFLILPVLLLSVVVHECAHGWMALRCGDTTARDRGRLTLNPLPHLDLVGSLLVPLGLLLFRSPILIGWAKPVPVNAASLAHPRDDTVKVALAGPASNLLLALGFAGLARLAAEAGTAAAGGMWAPWAGSLATVAFAGVVLNCALALFNLIPVPPLDGSWVAMRFLPLRHTIALRQFRFVGMALVALMLSSRSVSSVVFEAPLRLAVGAFLGLFGVSGAGVSP